MNRSTSLPFPNSFSYTNLPCAVIHSDVWTSPLPLDCGSSTLFDLQKITQGLLDILCET